MVRAARRLLPVLAVVSMTACAGMASTTRGTHYDRYKISPEEVQEAQGQANNLYVLVQRLRPFWLSGDVVVYQEQSLMGNPDVLRNLPPDYADRLEYLDRSQAVARLAGLGSRHIDGAIVFYRR